MPTLTSTSAPAGTASGALDVALRDVGRSFEADGTARLVLSGIDLDVRAGEVVAIVGPSGCGKSTLLRSVAGLDLPTTGHVEIGGVPVDAVDQRVAVAFQEPRLLPWRSLYRNVALGLPPGIDRAAGARRVGELLALVGLTDAAGLRPRQVSGGMAQRTSLARALARNPAVLVLDEPFGALDALTRLRMQDLLLDIHRTEPATILLVTHDVDEALALADRVVLIGSEPESTGSTIRRIVDAPGSRPRDRADAAFSRLRTELLVGLGVDLHHTNPQDLARTSTDRPTHSKGTS